MDHGVNDPKLTVTWLVFDDSIEDCFGFQILLVPIEHVGQDRTQEGILGSLFNECAETRYRFSWGKGFSNRDRAIAVSVLGAVQGLKLQEKWTIWHQTAGCFQSGKALQQGFVISGLTNLDRQLSKMAWDSSLQPGVQRGASGFELAPLNIQQHAHRGSTRRTQIIRFADPCFGLLQITVLEVPMGQRDTALRHGVGLQGITRGLASLGVSEASLSMCQVHAARLPQRYGLGVGHRGLFGPLVHQASIAVLFPANGILICLEQRLGLGPNDSGRNPIQCGIRIGAGQRGAVGKFGPTANKERPSQEGPAHVLMVGHTVPSSAPSGGCAR